MFSVFNNFFLLVSFDFVPQIFEKALDEPKYSSLYAQLCHRLFRDAPNFEPPESNITVRSLLVSLQFVVYCHLQICRQNVLSYLKTVTVCNLTLRFSWICGACGKKCAS